jgi:hypothetical protein
MATSSIGGLIRQRVVDANLPGVTGVFRDYAPPAQAKPYITYADELTNSPVFIGDGLTRVRQRLIQFDLWQDRPNENTELIDLLVNFLDGLKNQDFIDPYLYMIRVYDIQRTVEPNDNVVHHAVTLHVYQKVMR